MRCPNCCGMNSQAMTRHFSGKELDPGAYLRRHGADILGRSGLTAALLDHLPRKSLPKTGVGLDDLPIVEIARRSIALTHAVSVVSEEEQQTSPPTWCRWAFRMERDCGHGGR